MLGQSLLHPFRISSGLINFIDRDNNRHVRCLGMMSCFHRLRHHPIIRRHDQHHDIRGLCPTCSHGRKGLMAWGIQEGDPFIPDLDRISPDMLGDPTRLLFGHFGLPNGIEQ